MYLVDLIFILAGIVAIARNSKGWGPILIWLLLAPLAAALTFQSPHALRAQNMVVPLVVISAHGLMTMVRWLQKLKNKKLLAVGYWLLVILVAWGLARYLHIYYVHLAKEYPFSSQYGLKELVSYVGNEENKYKKVWVTDRYDQPYIIFLFYLQYPPQKFQGAHQLTPRDSYGFSTVRDFDKFHFEVVDFDKIRPENPNTLIVGTDDDIPAEANIVKKIYGTNGHLYFEIVAN